MNINETRQQAIGAIAKAIAEHIGNDVTNSDAADIIVVAAVEFGIPSDDICRACIRRFDL